MTHGTRTATATRMHNTVNAMQVRACGLATHLTYTVIRFCEHAELCYTHIWKYHTLPLSLLYSLGRMKSKMGGKWENKGIEEFEHNLPGPVQGLRTGFTVWDDNYV